MSPAKHDRNKSILDQSENIDGNSYQMRQMQITNHLVNQLQQMNLALVDINYKLSSNLNVATAEKMVVDELEPIIHFGIPFVKFPRAKNGIRDGYKQWALGDEESGIPPIRDWDPVRFEDYGSDFKSKRILLGRRLDLFPGPTVEDRINQAFAHFLSPTSKEITLNEMLTAIRKE